MSSFESWDTRNYERTDKQKKRAIEVGAPPKNTCLGLFLKELHQTAESVDHGYSA